MHAWLVLSKLQNSVLLLETPADLASAIDTAFIARHEEPHNATSRTVPIITIHSVIFLSSMCCGADSRAVLTSADKRLIHLWSWGKQVYSSCQNCLVFFSPPFKKSKKLWQLSVPAVCAEGAHLGFSLLLGCLKSVWNSVFLGCNFLLCASHF